MAYNIAVFVVAACVVAALGAVVGIPIWLAFIVALFIFN